MLISVMAKSQVSTGWTLASQIEKGGGTDRINHVARFGETSEGALNVKDGEEKGEAGFFLAGESCRGSVRGGERTSPRAY